MAAHFIAVAFTLFMLYTAWPGSSLFSWHPTLMSIAFITLMFEGLLVFNRESTLLTAYDRPTKLRIHQLVQIASITLALLGFAVIYFNKKINDKPHFTSWHGLFGVTTIVFVCLQAFGGDVVYYPWLRNALPIKRSLGVLKIYHATSGLIGWTLVTVTLMLALYSTWFVERVGRVFWWLSLGCVSFMAVTIMNQVVQEYLPRTRKQPVMVPEKSSKKRSRSNYENFMKLFCLKGVILQSFNWKQP